MTNTETAYEKWDEVWATETGRANWLDPLPDVIACAERLRSQGARTVLDLGCGVGRHALVLAKMGFDVTALDASQSGLDEVHKSAEALGVELKTVPGLMTELPFEDGSFDYVVSINVIYHGAPDVVKRAVSEISRVLVSEGTFQGTLLSKRRSDYGLGEEIAPDTFVRPDEDGDKSHPHYFCNGAELVQVLENFELRSLEDVGDDGSWHWHFVAERTW
ncbi:MAG: class I SAM-dependent methyltransferase [Pseudomonadota bacterium]